MATVSLILLFLMYFVATAAFYSVSYFYGNFISTLDGGMFYFQLVLLCLALLVIWSGFLFLMSKYLRYATKKHDMFKRVDKYGLKSTSSAGITTLAVLSLADVLFYVFFLLERENQILNYVTLSAVIAFSVVNFILYVYMWGKCQTYNWCKKCGTFWGKTYYVADEIGRETHEFRYKERERASTVENAQGELVASVYNDVEKTGYNVRYYYRLRHHCKYCGDWEEQINIDKPTMFDGAWMEPYESDVAEHINVTLTGDPEQRPQPTPQRPPMQPLAPSLPSNPQGQLNGTPYTGQALNDIALQQLNAPRNNSNKS